MHAAVFRTLVLENRRDEKMAEIPDKITLIIDRFLKALSKKNILIEQAILFGSYTQGNFNDWSDIDLAIVSQAFEGDRFKDRDKIRSTKLDISSDLEPIPYTPNEFNKDDPFVKKIIETGIRIV